MEFREAEGALRDPRADPLNDPPDPTTPAAQVVAPVDQRPDLVPVHDDAIPAKRARAGCRQQGEVRKRRGVDRVIPAAAAD